MGAATAIEWRGLLTVLTAVVRSTLPEALAEAVTEAQTLAEGEVREPVTGEARTGEAKAEPGALTTSANEADGVSGGDVAEGDELSGCEGVGVRHGVEDRRAEQVALSAKGAPATGSAKRWRGDDRRRHRQHRGRTETGEVKRGVQRVLTEPTTDMRSMVSEALAEAVTEALTLAEGEVRKPVSGGARTGDADVGGVADDKRSETDGVSGAMSPKAASRADVGTLPRGRALKHDARAMSGCQQTKRGGSVSDRKREAWGGRRGADVGAQREGGRTDRSEGGGRPTSPSGAG